MNIIPQNKSHICYVCTSDYLTLDDETKLMYCPSCTFIMGNEKEINASHFLDIFSYEGEGVRLHDIGCREPVNSKEHSSHPLKVQPCDGH